MYLKNHNKKESSKVSIKSMKILNGLRNKIMSDQAGIEISVKKENVNVPDFPYLPHQALYQPLKFMP